MLVQVFGKLDSPYCSSWYLSQVSHKIVRKLKGVINLNRYMYDFLKFLSIEENLKDLALSLISALDNCGFKHTNLKFRSEYISNFLPTLELTPKLVDLDLSS